LCEYAVNGASFLKKMSEDATVSVFVQEEKCNKNAKKEQDFGGNPAPLPN